MVNNLSGLMPPRTPHHISFFCCDIKERNMEKKENNALLHFSTEKCPELPLLRGERIFGRVERSGTRKVSGS